MKEAPRNTHRRVLAAVIVLVVALIVILAAFVLWRQPATTTSGTNVGDNPPDFTLPDTNNIQWNLQSHIRNGKPILLEFVHPQASFCQLMGPVLNQVQMNYSGAIEIVSIAVTFELQGFTNPPDQISTSQFKSALGSMWTYLYEEHGTQVKELYNIRGLPTLFLLGKDGRIAWMNAGWVAYQALKEQIESVL